MNVVFISTVFGHLEYYFVSFAYREVSATTLIFTFHQYLAPCNFFATEKKKVNTTATRILVRGQCSHIGMWENNLSK